MAHLQKRTRAQASIDRELYRNRINVAMVRAERSTVFSEFERSVRVGLVEQIEFVAKPEYVDSVLLVTKAKTPAEQQISAFLSGQSLKVKVEFVSYLVWAGEVGGQAFLDRNGIEGVFGLTNPQLVKHFTDRKNLLIQGIDEYTATWIADKIKRGSENGLNVNDIVAMLKNEALDISSVRAKRIAVTELAYAMTVVQVEAAKRLGVTEKKWVTSRDELVCPVCQPLDGKVIGISESFEALGAKTVNVVQGPPAHVNCRCFIMEQMQSILDTPESYWLGA